ncbi:MAG: iron-sulfur cluster assembly scaffold protein, partial [Verrucomicrobia bacterium]|nr:iron-sulfur cluster assembly scaffold protein [Verrucomicrobiota bacterium]
CQTAIAVASMATELLKGKTLDQARALSANDLSGPLGALPPMKIHCGQLVEGALRNALDGASTTTQPGVSTLADDMQKPAGKVKINLLP